jgi:hypothetical protein
LLPEKAAEMDKVLTAYLAEIQAEDVQEVSCARLEELDRFEARAHEVHQREVRRFGENPDP